MPRLATTRIGARSGLLLSAAGPEAGSALAALGDRHPGRAQDDPCGHRPADQGRHLVPDPQPAAAEVVDGPPVLDRGLPELGRPVMDMAGHYVREGLIRTGAPNLVSAVILDFRAYDTLGEATVLFTAVTGVVVVLRAVGKKR